MKKNLKFLRFFSVLCAFLLWTNFASHRRRNSRSERFALRKHATSAPLLLFPLKSCDFRGPRNVRVQVAKSRATPCFCSVCSFWILFSYPHEERSWFFYSSFFYFSPVRIFKSASYVSCGFSRNLRHASRAVSLSPTLRRISKSGNPASRMESSAA